MAGVSRNLREALILAGIKEISRSGIQNFSVRQVAGECGISCATPYKYFKDRQTFVAAIMEYINELWAERQKAVLERTSNSTREKILEISLEYVRFLVENPHFRSIIMLKDEEFDSRYGNVKSPLSPISDELVRRYCAEVDMPEKTARLKTYIVRSLIYGAALMFDNEEFEYNDENMDLVTYAINREFDIA